MRNQFLGFEEFLLMGTSRQADQTRFQGENQAKGRNRIRDHVTSSGRQRMTVCVWCVLHVLCGCCGCVLWMCVCTHVSLSV